MKFSKVQVEIRIAILYAVFGGLWILFSDSLLVNIAPDFAFYTRLQTYKGWFFVAASALLIFALIKREIAMRVETTEKLQASEEQYRGLFEHMTEGYAYCKMLFENGQAVDWVYLNVNEAFEILTGLREVAGKRVSEIIPGIRNTDPELFEVYSRVALTGKPEKFEIFLQALKIWFSISVYSPEREYFVAVFDVITERKQAEEALRRFELLSEHSRDIILFMRRDDGRILEANAAAIQAYGYSRDELLALSIQDLRASGTQNLTADQMAQADSGGILFETAHLRNDGSTFPVEVSSQGATIGSVRTLVNIVRDITERKKAEEALKESEEKYRNLFSNMSEGFGLHEIILDAAGKPCDYRFLELNDAFEKMTGISREKALGRNVREVLPDIDPDWIETYGRVALTGEPVHYVNYSTPLGRWYETYGFSPRKNQFAVVFYDITKRKKAEEALRQSEERLKRAQEIAHLGSWELDLVNNELTWSDEAHRIFGLRPQEFGATYEAFLEAVHPDDRIAVDQAYTESIRDGRDSYEIVHRVIKRASGEIRIVHEKCEHFRNESGQIIRSIGMVHDITERVQAEVELHRTLEELKSSNAELEQFAYVASHDLQEPLRGIAGLAQILQQRYQGQLDSQADEFIDLIVDGTQRMQTLINDLLAYSRIGRRGEAIRSTGAEAALKAVMQNLSVGIREYGATITNDSLPTVKADATQLIQLFQNLISNAVKFRAERPPRIHIGVSDAGDCWQFSIRDNGIGIEPQYFERIFQVFQRLHTRREYKGTGIGLAICKKIIERHGGRIWVESEIGHGTTFYFTLPKGN